MPVSAWKARAKWRGESRARAARASNGEVAAGVLGDPLLEVAQRLPVGGLGGQLDAELGLVARAAQEDDQMAGDGEGDVPAEVLLDQGEREVDAGGDAGGGGEAAVPDEDGVRVHVDLRIAAGEVVAGDPVGRHPVPVEESGLGEEQRPGADGDQASGPRGVRAQPVDEGRVGRPGPLAARDDEGVRRAVGDRLFEGGVGEQAQSALGADRPAVEGGGPEGVRGRVAGGAAGTGEHLEGAGDVEALHVVEEDDENGSLRHDSILGRPGGVRNDVDPTFPAIGRQAFSSVPTGPRCSRRTDQSVTFGP
ncbi:hypothetical protein SNARM312S_03373 [Streptomyces narbonensis]